MISSCLCYRILCAVEISQEIILRSNSDQIS